MIISNKKSSKLIIITIFTIIQISNCEISKERWACIWRNVFNSTKHENISNNCKNITPKLQNFIVETTTKEIPHFDSRYHKSIITESPNEQVNITKCKLIKKLPITKPEETIITSAEYCTTDKISTEMISYCEKNNNTNLLKNRQYNFMPFPWTVAILSNIRKTDELYISTGSLIHPKIVLTVAHLYQKILVQILLIRAGITDLSNINELNISQHRSVIKKIIHKDFNSATNENNIALLILQKSFELTDNIKPICLTSSKFESFNHLKCYISGWCQRCGIIDLIINNFDVSIIGQSNQCKSDTTIQYLKSSSLLMCTDTCNIDNGSPLICRNSKTNRYYQFGIVSSAETCENQYQLSYSNIIKLRSWIDKSLDCSIKSNGSSNFKNHYHIFYLILFVINYFN